jgi:hypothetical protein
MVDAASEFRIFGIPIMFKDYKQDILIFDPELEVRESIELTEDGKNASLFFNEVSFQYIFEKKTFTFNYYTVGDLFT